MQFAEVVLLVDGVPVAVTEKCVITFASNGGRLVPVVRLDGTTPVSARAVNLTLVYDRSGGSPDDPHQDHVLKVP